MVDGGVLVSQDLSCAGQVSLGVALPILGATGLRPTVLPTAILSTHTGGFGSNTFLDMSDEMAKIIHHWQKVQLTFSGLYLGYLGQAVLDFWLDNFEKIKLNDEAILIDPVMGDQGRLYHGINSEYVKKMRKLISWATILTPNLTEAAFLLGEQLDTTSLEVAKEMASELAWRYEIPNVIITGIPWTNDKITEVGITNGKCWSLYQNKMPGSYFGTGDMFASAFFSAIMHKKEMEQACSIAADFVATAIKYTSEQDQRFGPNYAKALPILLKELDK